MNELQVFENEEFGKVRTLTIDNEPWFVGKDVTEALGFVNSRDAIATHVFLEDKGVEIIDTLGGKQTMTIINESGLYALVFGSRLESAKRFNTGSHPRYCRPSVRLAATRCSRRGKSCLPLRYWKPKKSSKNRQYKLKK